MSLIHTAVAIIRDDDNNILIQKKSKRYDMIPELANKWEFPGGKLKDHEDPRMALYREIKEELGVIITIARFIGQFVNQYSFGEVQLWVYECRVYDRIVAHDDQQEIRWIQPEWLCEFPDRLGKMDDMIARL